MDPHSDAEHDLTAVTMGAFDLTYVLRLTPVEALEQCSGPATCDGGQLPANPTLGDLMRAVGMERTPGLLALLPGTPAASEGEFRTTGQAWNGAGLVLAHRYRLRTRPDGSTALIGAARDVTAEVAERERLVASERRYRLLAEHSADFAMQTNPDRVIEYVSSSVTESLGWAPSDLLGQLISDYIHPDDRAHAAALSLQLNDGKPVFLRTRFRHADGAYRWMAQQVRPVRDDDGTVLSRIGVWRDVTAEVEATEALAASERRFRLAMRSAPTGIAVLDPHRRFVAVNPALCQLLGREEQWLLAHSVFDIVQPDAEVSDPALHARVTIALGESASAELSCRRPDGTTVWVQQAVGALTDSEGTLTGYVSHFVDVTEARLARERLSYLAWHDDLTGALRPAALLAGLEPLLHAGIGEQRPAALFVDVDGLKQINDTMGHEAGDSIIQEAARRITTAVRGTDLVGRIGGDEFVVVLPAVRGGEDAMRVAEKIQDGFVEPLDIADTPIRITVSIGVSLAEPGENGESLLHRADVALYRSKREGRSRSSLFDESLDGTSSAARVG